MGLLDSVLGPGPSDISIEKFSNELSPLLLDEEEILAPFRAQNDIIILTSRRVILIKSFNMKKRGYLTIPYSSIVLFEKEGAGVLDLDAELKIWFKGQDAPYSRKFSRKDSNINKIYNLLSEKVLE